MQYIQDYDEFAPPVYTCSADTTPSNSTTCTAPTTKFYSTKTTPGLLEPYTKSYQLFVCPSHSNNAQGYGYNRRGFALYPNYGITSSGTFSQDGKITNMAAIEKPSQLIVMADAYGTHYAMYNNLVNPPDSTDAKGIYPYHLEMGNVLWADGHVKAVKPLQYNGVRGYWFVKDNADM